MRSLEGANCGDLPDFVIDKYFNAAPPYRPFHHRVPKAICAHCVVLQECRVEALAMPTPPRAGVIGGMSGPELRVARAWRRFEQGLRDEPPSSLRPDWLPMTDATHQVEGLRMELDGDEPIDNAAADCHE